MTSPTAPQARQSGPDSTDNSVPGAHLQEEPQEERGAPGSRDTGSDEPAGGPVDRPVGTSDADDSTAIDPQEPRDPSAPTLPAGDQGG
jgi:hypothetical protein